MPQRNDPDYAPMNDVSPPTAPSDDIDIPMEETEILEDDIKKLGALDTESAEANKSLNRVVTKKKTGKSHVPWNAPDHIKYNEASRLFSANASVHIDQIIPNDVYVDTIPLVQAPDWASFTRIVKERYWRGDDAEFKWQLVQYGNMIRAVGKLKLQRDPRVQAKWDPNKAAQLQQEQQQQPQRQEFNTPLSMPGMAGVASPISQQFNPMIGMPGQQFSQQFPQQQQQPQDDPRIAYLFDTLRGLESKLSDISSVKQEPQRPPDPAFSPNLQHIQNQISQAVNEDDEDDYDEDDYDEDDYDETDYDEDDYDDEDLVRSRRRKKDKRRRRKQRFIPPMPPPPTFIQMPGMNGAVQVPDNFGLGMQQFNPQQQQFNPQQQQSVSQQQANQQQFSQQQSVPQQQSDQYIQLLTKLTEEVTTLKSKLAEKEAAPPPPVNNPPPPPPPVNMGIPQGMLGLPGSLSFTPESQFRPPKTSRPIPDIVESAHKSKTENTEQQSNQQPIQQQQQPIQQQQPQIVMQLPPQAMQQFLPPPPPPQPQQPPQPENQIQYVPVPMPPPPPQQAPIQQPIQQSAPIQPIQSNQPQSIQEQLAGFTSFVDTIKSAAMQLGIANNEQQANSNVQQSQADLLNSQQESKDPYEGMPFRVVETPGWNFVYDRETGKPMDWMTTAFVNSSHLGGIFKAIGSRWTQIQEQMAMQQGGPTPNQINSIRALEQQAQQVFQENQQLKAELQRRSEMAPQNVPPQANQQAIAEPPPIEDSPTRNTLLRAVKAGKKK